MLPLQDTTAYAESCASTSTTIIHPHDDRRNPSSSSTFAEFALRLTEEAILFYSSVQSDDSHFGQSIQAEAYGLVAEEYFKNARFEQCIVWCQRALEASHASSIKVMETLALSYSSLGIYAPAMQIYRHLLEEVMEGKFPSLRTANTIHNMGVTLRGMGRFDEAIQAFNEALQIYLNSSLEDGGTASVANTIKNLGFVHSEQGRHREAIDCFHRALVIEKRLGSNDLGLVNTLNSLGVVYSRLGLRCKAMSHYADALKFLKGLDSYESHVDVGDLFFNIGLTSWSLNDVEFARQNLQKSAHIFVTCLGSGHPKSRRAKSFTRILADRKQMRLRHPRKRPYYRRHFRRRRSTKFL